MTVKEWLKNTYVDERYYVRQRMRCKDGYNISIQAHAGAYCSPRENLKNGSYTHLELGFPSEADELINEYAEAPYAFNYTDMVYPYVPIIVVEKLIKKHGGIEWSENT